MCDVYWSSLALLETRRGVKYVSILMYVSRPAVIVQRSPREPRSSPFFFFFPSLSLKSSTFLLHTQSVFLSPFWCRSGGGRRRRGGSELRGRPQLPLGAGEMVVHRSQQVRGKDRTRFWTWARFKIQHALFICFFLISIFFFLQFIRTEDTFFPQREPLIRECHPPFFQCLAVGVKRQNSMFGKEKQRRKNGAVRNRDTLEGCVNPSVFNFRTLRENKSYYFRYDSVPDLIWGHINTEIPVGFLKSACFWILFVICYILKGYFTFKHFQTFWRSLERQSTFQYLIGPSCSEGLLSLKRWTHML